MSLLKLSSLHSEPDQVPPLWRRAVRWVRWHLPTRVTSFRIMSGRLRGMKIVTSLRDYPAAIAGITEPQLVEWFSREAGAGETWLDIGAHYGYTALALARSVGPTGRVFAFEPMTATAGCLARTRYLNHCESITVIPLALGSVEGMQLERLMTVRGMADNTLSGTKDTHAAERWSEMLLVAQFDWLWPRVSGGDQKIHGIKIDVQGMELHVLKGMVSTLKSHRPKLVVEFHRGVDRAEILSLLTECGYSTAAHPIEPKPDETTAQFFDDRSYAFHPVHGR